MLCQEQLSLDRPVLPLLHLPPSESSKSSGSKIRQFHEAFDSPFVFSADVRCFCWFVASSSCRLQLRLLAFSTHLMLHRLNMVEHLLDILGSWK